MIQPEFDPDRERTFVADVLRGNPADLERLSERLTCVPRMLAVRNSRTPRPLSPEDLLDLVQDTFVVILRKLPDYKAYAPLESWIYGICCLQLKAAKRTIARHLDRFRSLSSEAIEDASTVRPPDDLAEVHTWLRQLGGMEAELTRLRHFEDLTFQELASRLELSRNTAKTLYYRGLDTLRDLAGDEPEEECQA